MDNQILQLIVLALVAIVAIEGLLLVGIMRQVGGLLLRLSPLGRPGEVEGGPELEAAVDISGIERGKAAVVLFLSSGCSLCDRVLTGVPALRRNYPELQLIAVPGGDEGDRLTYARMLGDIARPDLFPLYQDWKVGGTPFGVGLDSESRVRISGVVNNLEHLEGMAEIVIQERSVTEDPSFIERDGTITHNGYLPSVTMPTAHEVSEP